MSAKKLVDAADQLQSDDNTTAVVKMLFKTGMKTSSETKTF